ncbi:MAG: hypothetical protein LBF23_02030 [Endomicrobium sp.]|jgi:hypothetical protein|nr:hypothetical protein [Endomicrobium sp.]
MRKQDNNDWFEKIKDRPEVQAMKNVSLDEFGDLLKKAQSYHPKSDTRYLTLEQCQSINKDLFKSSSKNKLYIKTIIDRVETNFEKGKITEEERNAGIAAFNRLTKSNFVRREGKGDERKYIFEDFEL